MATYNWLIILLALESGLLYASTYDVIATAHENYAFTDDPTASLGAEFLAY